MGSDRGEKVRVIGWTQLFDEMATARRNSGRLRLFSTRLRTVTTYEYQVME